MKINELRTPCYVIDEGKLTENLLILNSTSKQDIKECKEKIDSIIGIATEKEKENGVISWEDRIAAYKRKKGEEIYIRTNKGNAKEITEFVSERQYICSKSART